jgi:hypothetical protein
MCLLHGITDGKYDDFSLTENHSNGVGLKNTKQVIE